MKTSEAIEGLDAMQAARLRLAAAVTCPPERHLVFALLMGGLVASQAATPFLTLALEALFALSVGAVIAWDRKRTGMFISGYQAGRTRPLTFSLLVIALALGALGVWLKLRFHLWWAPLPCGVAVTLVAFCTSVTWQRIYAAELRTTP